MLVVMLSYWDFAGAVMSKHIGMLVTVHCVAPGAAYHLRTAESTGATQAELPTHVTFAKPATCSNATFSKCPYVAVRAAIMPS